MGASHTQQTDRGTATLRPGNANPALCVDCYGAGQLFTNYASDYCNPSVKSEWLTCDRCGGDGFEPQADILEEDK